jgi:hypothetical protein
VKSSRRWGRVGIIRVFLFPASFLASLSPPRLRLPRRSPYSFAPVSRYVAVHPVQFCWRVVFESGICSISFLCCVVVVPFPVLFIRKRSDAGSGGTFLFFPRPSASCLCNR